MSLMKYCCSRNNLFTNADPACTIVKEHPSYTLVSFHLLTILDSGEICLAPSNCNSIDRKDTFSSLLRRLLYSLCKKYDHMGIEYRVDVLVVKIVQSKLDKYSTSPGCVMSSLSLILDLIVWFQSKAFTMNISVPTFQTFLQRVS